MAIPAGIATVVVTGRYIRPDGSPLTGTVTFEPPPRLTFPDADTISAGAATVALDGDGAFLVTLIATDVPGMQPEDWTYTVTERMARAPERTYHVALPSATPAVDLADIAPADPAHGDYVLITGPAGADGEDGTQLLSASGAPTNGQGADGDFYVDTTPGDPTLYGPKAGGTWPTAGISLGRQPDRGVYVPRGWGEHWRAKRDAAAAGKAKIIFMGDSVTKGYYVSNLVTKSYPGVIRTALQTAYGDGGSGLYSVNRSAAIVGAKPEAVAAWSANGSIIATTGTWTDTDLYYGPGISSIYATAAATATFSVRGTTLKIYTLAGVNTPNAGYTYSIDGGAPVAVPDPGLSSGSTRTTTVTGLSAGNHTVVISYNGSAGARLQLIGVSAENSTGVVVDNAGRSGVRSDHYAVSGTGNTLWHGGSLNPADLVVYPLGLNDANQSVALDTWANNTYQILNTIKGAGNGATDLLILLQHRGSFASTPYSQYGARARGIAEEYGAALINLWPMGRNNYTYWSELGYWGTATNPGAAGADTVHPSDAGHQYIADQVLPLLMS